ncbi:MAG: amidohydrolase [Christensenellaceae bacterium]|nr:amidohydrolase [Christensenellaceae bacterium]
MLLIKNAKIITMAEKDFPKGDILIDNSKIVRIAEAIEAGDTEVFDAQGLTAIPGIVDAHCHIGMWEDGIDAEGADGNEATDPITPQLRAIDAINPVDRCFEEALAGGVTTVVTGPGSANVIGGQFVAMKTYGTNVDEMAIKSPASLKTALGENPKMVYGGQKKAPSTRMATAALYREALIEAQNSRSDKEKKRSLKNEILLDALDGKLPVKVHAHRADDIQTALRIAKEFSLTISLDHCTEGYLIPQELKQTDARVIIGPLLCDRCKPELKNLSMDAPRILWENGIEFAIMSDHPVTLTQHLPVVAAMAVRHGLPEQEALKAITINAARAAWIDDRIGSLEEGKDADIVLFAGDPLDIRTRIEAVFIDGKKVK